MDAFFKPITVNKLTIPNRFAMAPMTRSKSPDGIPGDNVRDYYHYANIIHHYTLPLYLTAVGNLVRTN